MKDLSKIDPKHNIIIKGARLHNLKNIDVVIPRNKFTVITGLSDLENRLSLMTPYMQKVRGDMLRVYHPMQGSLWVNLINLK